MAKKKKSRRTLPVFLESGLYYTRIRWGTKPRFAIKFPLCTDTKAEAEHRRDIIAETSLKGEIISAYRRYGSEGVKRIKNKIEWQRKGGSVVRSEYTLVDAVDEYREYLIGQRLAQTTVDLYMRDLKSFADITRIKYVSAIQPRHFSRFKRKLTHLSRNTVNRQLRALQTFCNWMYDEGHIENPVRIKKLPVIATPVNYFSNEEFELILANVKKGFPHREAKMDADDIELFLDAYRLYRDTGLRLSEPFNNELKVDSDGFRLQIIGSTTKNSYKRFVHLTEFQATTIIRMNEWVDVQLKRGRVHREYTIKVFSRVFKKALQKSGIKGKFHDLRKTFATRLYFLTGSEFALCHALGHTDTNMTKQYTSCDKIELVRAYSDIARLRNLKDSPENSEWVRKNGYVELYSNFGFMYQ